MLSSSFKLLLGAVVALALMAIAAPASGQTLIPCLPGIDLGCEEEPPEEEPPPSSSGPSGPGGEPQPPPQPPPPPDDSCPVERSRGSGTFPGVVAEQIYGTESNYRGCALTGLAKAGARIIRQPMRWAEIERERGEYDFGWWDRYMRALAKHRIQLLPILFEPPEFRAKKGKVRGVYPPRSRKAMGKFAARLVRRYGPDGRLWKRNPELPKTPIRRWQVWNEPNLRFYWPPKPNARAYTKLLKVVGRRIKRVDPKAEIVTAGIPQSSIKGSVPQRKYLRKLYRAGAADHFDTVAIHSYTETHRAFAKQVKGIRRVMRRNRDRSKLWITEIGWATGGPDKKFTPGRKGQKRRITRTFRFLKRNRRSLGIRGIVYYMWQDAKPYAGFRDFWGLHTGLLDIDGKPKPGMKAFRRHARSVQ